jgi:hypothetical protein
VFLRILQDTWVYPCTLQEVQVRARPPPVICLAWEVIPVLGMPTLLARQSDLSWESAIILKHMENGVGEMIP